MTGIHAITMPKWGLAMTEGKVAGWEVGEGDAVSPGTEILEIETSKITNVLETEHAGTLRRICAREDETLPVGALLGVIAQGAIGEDVIDAFIKGFQAEMAAVAAVEEVAAAEPELVDVAGRSIRYLKTGEQGSPILMIHGFGGDLNNWMFNQPVLAEHHVVYAIDLPGHGGSSKDVGVGDMDALVAAVDGFMGAVGLEAAHLVGHSLGGAIAIGLALAHPGRALSLTLVCSAGLGEDIADDYITGFMAAGRRKDIKPLIQMLFADPSLVSRDMLEDILKYKRLDGVETALASIAGAVFADGRQGWVARDRLGEIAIPVQAIWGDEDKIVPVAHSAGLPGSVGVHVFEGKGHMVHMEAAPETNRLIEQIAAGVSSG